MFIAPPRSCHVSGVHCWVLSWTCFSHVPSRNRAVAGSCLRTCGKKLISNDRFGKPPCHALPLGSCHVSGPNSVVVLGSIKAKVAAAKVARHGCVTGDTENSRGRRGLSPDALHGQACSVCCLSGRLLGRLIGHLLGKRPSDHMTERLTKRPTAA